MSRASKRRERQKSPWEYHFNLPSGERIIYLMGSRRAAVEFRGICGDGFVFPNRQPLIHNGGKP